MSLQEAMLIVRFLIITTCALLMCYERMVKSHIAGPKTKKYLTIRTLGPKCRCSKCSAVNCMSPQSDHLCL